MYLTHFYFQLAFGHTFIIIAHLVASPARCAQAFRVANNASRVSRMGLTGRQQRDTEVTCCLTVITALISRNRIVDILLRYC